MGSARLPKVTPPRRWLTRAGLPGLVLVAGVVLSAGYLVRLARPLWFVMDDWDFLLRRGVLPGTENHGIWLPHADHWMTIPVLIYRLWAGVFGLDYLAYVLIPICLNAAIALVMFGLLKQVGISRWPAAGCGLLIAFAGVGGEALLWDGTMGLLGSALLGLIAVRGSGASLGGRWRLPVFGWIALVLALMCSGTGLSALAMAVAFVALQSGLRRGLLLGSVPLACYLTWYLWVGRTDKPLVGGGDYTILLQLPRYVWTLLTTSLEHAAGLTGIGAALALAVVLAPMMAVRATGAARNLAWAGLLGVLTQLILSGVTRSFIGGWENGISRYAYLVLVFAMPAIGLLVDAVGRMGLPARPIGILGAILLLGYCVHGAALARAELGPRALVSHPEPATVAGFLAAYRSGEAVLSPGIDAFVNHAVSVELMDNPAMRRALGSQRPGPQDILAAESWYMTAAGEKNLPVPWAAEQPSYAGLSVAPTATARCDRVSGVAESPTITFPIAAGGSKLSITPTEQVILKTQLHRGPVSAPARDWPAASGPVQVGSTAAGATLSVVLPGAQSYIVCR